MLQVEYSSAPTRKKSPYPQFQSIADPIAYSLGGGTNASLLDPVYSTAFNPTEAAAKTTPVPAGATTPIPQQLTAPSDSSIPTPATPPTGPGGVDLSGDPILMQIRAMTQANVQGAQADELAGRKGALIGFGYDERLKDLYPDDTTRETAKQNKFSQLGQLAHNYETGTHDLEEEINKRNLFYSGARGVALGENARNYELQQAGAYGGLNEKLAALRKALLDTQTSAAQQNAQGVSDAYGRYTPPSATPAAPTAPPALSPTDMPAAAPGREPQAPTPPEPTAPSVTTSFPVEQVPNPVEPFPVEQVPNPVATYPELTSPAPSYPTASVTPTSSFPVGSVQSPETNNLLLAALVAAAQQQYQPNRYNDPLAWS